MSRDAILKKVVSRLPEDMKTVYDQAVAGSAESQYKIGMYLYKSGDADTMAVGIGALAMSAKQGHSGARSFWESERKDWREYL